MSRSVYGMVEVFDKKTNLWKAIEVKFCTENNESTADFYLGASSLASAIMGEDDFDFGNEDEDFYAVSKKQKGLNAIESWFNSRVRSSQMKLRTDLSPEVLTFLTPNKEDPYGYTPTNITFTLMDLQTLKRFAKDTSKRAKAFYKYNFSMAENILKFVYRNYQDLSFMSTGNEIRMTVAVF